MRAGEDAPTQALDRGGKTCEVLERMQACLAWDAQARPGVEGGERRTLALLHAAKPGAVRSGELLVEGLDAVARGEEEIALDAREVAVDALLGDVGLDPVDRRGMAFGGKPCAMRAVHAL